MTADKIKFVIEYLKDRKDNNLFADNLYKQIISDKIEIIDPKTKQKKLVNNTDDYRIYLIKKSINPKILNKIIYKKEQK